MKDKRADDDLSQTGIRCTHASERVHRQPPSVHMLACVCVSVGIYMLLSRSEVGANRQQRTFLDCSGTVNSILACNNLFFHF